MSPELLDYARWRRTGSLRLNSLGTTELHTLLHEALDQLAVAGAEGEEKDPALYYSGWEDGHVAGEEDGYESGYSDALSDVRLLAAQEEVAS